MSHQMGRLISPSIFFFIRWWFRWNRRLPPTQHIPILSPYVTRRANFKPFAGLYDDSLLKSSPLRQILPAKVNVKPLTISCQHICKGGGFTGTAALCWPKKKRFKGDPFGLKENGAGRIQSSSYLFPPWSCILLVDCFMRETTPNPFGKWPSILQEAMGRLGKTPFDDDKPTKSPTGRQVKLVSRNKKLSS